MEFVFIYVHTNKLYPHISFKKTKTTQEHVMDKKVAPSMARETPREAQRGPERPWGTDSSLGSSLTPVTTYRPELKKPAANSLIHQLTEHEMAADELFFN